MQVKKINIIYYIIINEISIAIIINSCEKFYEKTIQNILHLCTFKTPIFY
jgi:hypothetical protein